VLKRFMMAFAAFVGLIVPGALAMALLAAPAKPAPGCLQLKQVFPQLCPSSVAEGQARLNDCRRF
jgi:chromate transport protein ChrA